MDDHTVKYQTSAIRVAPDDVAITKVMALRSKTPEPNSAAEPMYHHRSKHRTQPDQPRHENRTLSGYWEINGVKAHCLLDSGSEGVLLSPEFTCATDMKTFAFEQPIALQLACIGSRSTINYGMNTTIRFGRKIYNEYFDVANVEYYDAILGTPFLRKLGITLEFTSPGAVRIGNESVPIGKNSADEKSSTEGQRPKASESAPESRPPRLIEARRTSRLATRPHRVPTIIRSIALILR
jgi:hypothetical protein